MSNTNVLNDFLKLEQTDGYSNASLLDPALLL